MFKCSGTLNQWDLIVGGAFRCDTAQIKNCSILLHHKRLLSLKWPEITNSLKTQDFWFLSRYKWLWVWTSFWKAWWKSALWISSPTRHTELSLWTAAARGFSNTQRLLSKSHNRNKNKAWAQNYSWPARPIRPAHNIQNTLSGPIRLHSTRPSDLHTQSISPVITGLERREREER